MALRITKVGELVGREIVITGKRAGDFAELLTNLESTTAIDPGPALTIELMIGEGPSARLMSIDLAIFMSTSQYTQSQAEPIFIDTQNESTSTQIRHFLLFRDRFFIPERTVRSAAEREEVVLRVKRAVYDDENELTSLRSYVSNVEASIEFQNSGPKREPIPDDVKLLVWSRDGGACVRCHSKDKLHFDHIIPVVKGGSNDAANVQLLCQACNLRKSDRIAF